MKWNAYERWVSSFFVNFTVHLLHGRSVNCDPKENITTIKQVRLNSCLALNFSRALFPLLPK